MGDVDERERFTRLISRNSRQFSFTFNPTPIFRTGNKVQSPAACLPYDILQEIFQYCLPESPLTTPQPNKTLAPLVLCHICTSWRIAAFEDHRLWKELHVCIRFARRNAPYKDIAVPRKQLDMITWWTTRVPNGEYAYSFNFTHRQVLPVRNLEGWYVNYREVFKIPGVRLARAVDMAIGHEQWELVCADSMPFSQLGSLALILTDTPGPSNLSIPPAPLLRRLDIGYLSYTFPWQQLTHLNVRRELSPYSWQELLEKCTNLQSAIFHLNPDHSPAGRQIVHPNLRQLVVQSDSFVRCDVFQGTLFPSLQSFRLSVTPHFSRHWPRTEFSTPISLGSLHTVLRSTPSLKELHLHNCINFSKTDFVSLLPQTSDPLSMFVPRLEHLIIEKMEERATEVPQNIAAFVHSQWMCADWNSHSPSERPPHRLHVEVFLRKDSIVEHVECAVGKFYDPNVQLTITSLQDRRWEAPLGSSSKPGVLDNWEDLVKFRIPLG